MNIEIRGQTFSLLPERALWWGSARALICSDLHWGRELFLQKQGMPVPEMSFAREAAVLDRLLERTGAEEWWILGDFIHHPEGMERRFVETISEWMKQNMAQEKPLKKIRFVPGNHDRGAEQWAREFPFTLEPRGILQEGFRFCHEPLAEKVPEFTWYGHLHPAIRLPILGAKKHPCFWIRPEQGFIPAFSRLAGGFEIEASRRRDQVYVIADGQVLPL